ncbi:MAG: FAD-binding oxidoreductase [Proteobacteria bacterium]|nr:FAD-binding oxidoreductase [Pseudomonadota bacterium]
MAKKKDERKPVIPNRIPREAYRALQDALGAEWVSEDRAVIETYSKFSVDSAGTLRKHMRDHTAIPACIALPAATEEVQAILRIANRFKVQVIPFTNGMIAFSGPTTPEPTICVHLSRMNRVLKIDEDNLCATLEAFADYGQLHAEAMKVGLWNGGTPLATTLCKLSSQTSFAGIWQTDLKYGTLTRNIISTKVVLPTGEIMITGSDAVSGVDSFWEYGPGPDLLSMVRGSAGTAGIITEITVKLHTWPGGSTLPEPPAGRPCIQNYYDPKYDTAPPPPRVKLLWVEFPDFDSEVAALHKVAQSGICIGLNATGVYNAYYCSQTQDMTMERIQNKFFPPYNLYVIICGITSEKQMEYDEKVFREIMAETGGTFLTETYKPDVLYALMPWNLDCIRHVTGFRMNRHYYGSSIVPGGSLKDTAYKTKEIWSRTINTYGETFVTDRGGVDDTPFLYAIERGSRFWLSEADVYPDAMKPELLQKARLLTFASVVDFVSQGYAPTGMGVLIEPLVSSFPESGPNANLLFRKFRKVFDPNNIYCPGRQTYTEEEFSALPHEIMEFINGMRTKYGMKPLT